MIKYCQKQIWLPTLLKISGNELEKIGVYLNAEEFKNIAIFFSEGIEEVFGQKIYTSLDAAGITIMHRNVISNINIENIIHTAFEIPRSVDALIGVGGGKALDYSKYCAHVLALPFISVPTSTSNDGFCSPNSSLLVEGKRKSLTAKIPYGVIVDIETVKTSPELNIYSGIGDLVSKITAGYDWIKAVELTNEEFNDFAYLIAKNSVDDMLNFKDHNIRDTEFLSRLVTSLLMSGISMEIAGFSRPASGSEHLISHTLDLIAKKPAMHGVQVGIGTYVCSYIQDNRFNVVRDFLFSTGFFNFVAQNPLDRGDFINAIKAAPTIKKEFYTVLSEKKNIERAIEFVEQDEICRRILG